MRINKIEKHNKSEKHTTTKTFQSIEKSRSTEVVGDFQQQTLLKIYQDFLLQNKHRI